MSDEGVFAVHRGVFKHPMFADEPYSEREAWFWLLGNAAWKAKRVRSGKAIVDLQRGQLAYAVSFLAEAWKWDSSKVRRYLTRLQKIEEAIDVQATSQTTIITIINYDTYQFQRRASEEQDDAQNDERTASKRRQEEEINNSKIQTEGSSAPARVSRETRKPRLIPLPDGWSPNLKHREIASRMSLDLRDQEERFRDYLNSNAKQYANYDAAFSNFLRNAPRFSRSAGNGYGGSRPLQNAGYGDPTKSVVAASDRLIEKLRAFDDPAPSDLRGGKGQASLRLISKG